MRKALYLSLVLGLAVSILSHAQEKEKVTISGKITVKGTGKPPIGIITIAEKGVVAYWAAGDNIGTNRHTFVEKDGSYRFTINKGGTIVIQDGYNRYLPQRIENIAKTQSKDLVLEPTKRTNPPAYPPHELLPHEKKIDIHKRIKISGTITFPDGKGMKNVSIGQLEVFNEETPGPIAYTTSGEGGVYKYSVLKEGRIIFVAQGYEMQIYTATQDTVINVKMKKINPFK